MYKLIHFELSYIGIQHGTVFHYKFLVHFLQPIIFTLKAYISADSFSQTLQITLSFRHFQKKD